jgi:hypothetical protein
MLLVGKITEVSLHELNPDTVTISGGVGDRYCSIEIKSMGIGEVLIGRFGLKRDEVTVQIGDGGDL